MNGKEHLLYGISTGAAIVLTSIKGADFEAFALIIGGAAIGSVLPDIDTKYSIVSKFTPGLSFVTNKLIKHRTYTHDLAIWIPLAIILTIKYPLLLGFFSGYLGHLFLDSMTKDGIAACYLLNKKPFHLFPCFLRFRSNSVVAQIVTVLLSVINILVIRIMAIK